MQRGELGFRLVLLVVTLAVDGRRDDEDHADQSDSPVRDVDTADADQHADREDTDRPVRTVLQVAELGERPRLHELDGHRTHEQRADTQTSCDQHDGVGDREGRRHAVERERAVLHLEIEEEREGTESVADRLLHVLVILALEDVAEQTDCHVQHDASEARDQQTDHVGTAERQRSDEHEQTSHEEADVVELADLRQDVLDRTQPLHLVVFEEEIEEDEQQVDPAEHRDVGVCVVQLLGVAVGVVERQRHHVPEVDLRREGDDRDREDEAHADDRDGKTEPEEDLLPPGAHPFEHLGVDHGVVERERDLQHDQDQQGDDRERRHEDADGRDDEQGDDHLRDVVPKQPTQCGEDFSHVKLLCSVEWGLSYGEAREGSGNGCCHSIHTVKVCHEIHWSPNNLSSNRHNFNILKAKCQ